MTSIDLDALESDAKNILIIHTHPSDCALRSWANTSLSLIQRLRAAEKDAVRWKFCVANGFPSRNGSAKVVERLWAANVVGVGKAGHGETAAEAVDAAIEQQRKIATGEDLGL
jgi:hypothetical protein